MKLLLNFKQLSIPFNNCTVIYSYPPFSHTHTHTHIDHLSPIQVHMYSSFLLWHAKSAQLMNSSVLIITHTPHCTKAVAHTQAAQRPIFRPPRHTPLPIHTHIHKHILGKAQIVPGFFGVPLLLFFSVCFYFLCFPSFFFLGGKWCWWCCCCW